MDLFEPCPFDEGILLDYINGHLDTQTRRAIERSPACMTAAKQLQATVAAWRPALRQMFCPSTERLVDYQERRLIGTDYLMVHQHVQNCTWCSAEVEMLAEVDSVSTESQPSLARRIYELIFQPAAMAPVPVLGEGSYRTIQRSPQVELFIRTNRIADKQGNWTLFGRVRADGEQVVSQVESIVMQDIEDETALELKTTVDEHGSFMIRGLETGIYRLRIILSEEEIVLSNFKVGDN